jgi:hypothetical protein
MKKNARRRKYTGEKNVTNDKKYKFILTQRQVFEIGSDPMVQTAGMNLEHDQA